MAQAGKSVLLTVEEEADAEESFSKDGEGIAAKAEKETKSKEAEADVVKVDTPKENRKKMSINFDFFTKTGKSTDGSDRSYPAAGLMISLGKIVQMAVRI